MGLPVFDSGLSDEERARLVEGIKSRGAQEEWSRRRHIHLDDVPEMSIANLATKKTANFFSNFGN